MVRSCDLLLDVASHIKAPGEERINTIVNMIALVLAMKASFVAQPNRVIEETLNNTNAQLEKMAEKLQSKPVLYRTNASDVNVRLKPEKTVDPPPIATLPAGTAVELRKPGEWMLVSLVDNKGRQIIGYIYGKYLEPVPSGP